MSETTTDPIADERRHLQRRLTFDQGHFEETVGQVVSRLRRVADEIEREHHNANRASAADTASYLVSALSNSWNNLRLDTLVRAAAAVDAGRLALATIEALHPTAPEPDRLVPEGVECEVCGDFPGSYECPGCGYSDPSAEGYR